MCLFKLKLKTMNEATKQRQEKYKYTKFRMKKKQIVAQRGFWLQRFFFGDVLFVNLKCK